MDAIIMVSTNCPITGEHGSIIMWRNRLPLQHYNLLKSPLISALSACISKTAQWNFFILLTFDKDDKMQLLAKFKKILYMGFRTTLNFENVSWLWTPCTEFF